MGLSNGLTPFGNASVENESRRFERVDICGDLKASGFKLDENRTMAIQLAVRDCMDLARCHACAGGLGDIWYSFSSQRDAVLEGWPHRLGIMMSLRVGWETGETLWSVVLCEFRVADDVEGGK